MEISMIPFARYPVEKAIATGKRIGKVPWVCDGNAQSYIADELRVFGILERETYAEAMLRSFGYLPCPFCGGTECVVQVEEMFPEGHQGWEAGLGKAYVWCPDCSMQGPSAVWGSPRGYSTKTVCRAKAIELWNTRAVL